MRENTLTNGDYLDKYKDNLLGWFSELLSCLLFLKVNQLKIIYPRGIFWGGKLCSLFFFFFLAITNYQEICL